MKQHITTKQLMEVHQDIMMEAINSDKFNELLEQVSQSNVGMRNLYLQALAKEVTIGKMIEILHDSGECIDMFNGNENGRFDGYCVWIGTLGETRKEELCDALWEAVKYVLEIE